MFLICLMTPVYCFSQTTSVVTRQDTTVLVPIEHIRVANYIFLEHEKVLKEIPLYDSQLAIQDSIINTQKLMISNRDTMLSRYIKMDADNKALLIKKDKIIDNLKLDKKCWMIGGISVSVTALILFLCMR